MISPGAILHTLVSNHSLHQQLMNEKSKQAITKSIFGRNCCAERVFISLNFALSHGKKCSQYGEGYNNTSSDGENHGVLAKWKDELLLIYMNILCLNA